MACSRSSEGATSLRRTATTTSRSSPTWRPTWPQMDPTSCGWRTSPTSPLRPASSTSPRSWMPGHAGLSATRSAARSMPVSPSRRSTRRFAHRRLPRAACITATEDRDLVLGIDVLVANLFRADRPRLAMAFNDQVGEGDTVAGRWRPTRDRFQEVVAAHFGWR